jgi:aromatase
MMNTQHNQASASVRFSLTHSIDVAVDAAQAYRLINAVEEWPGLFPPCKAARIVESDGDDILVEITAQVGTSVRTWRSRRTRLPSKHLVSFQQVDPFPPVARMTGHWRVHPVGSQSCRVELHHDFEVSEESSAQGTPARTLSEAEAWIRSVCDANSESELEAFRAACERCLDSALARSEKERS